MQHGVFLVLDMGFTPQVVFVHIYTFPIDTVDRTANTLHIEVIQKLLSYVFWGVSDAFRGLFADFAGFLGARFNMLALFGVLVSDVRVVSHISNPSGNVPSR